MRIYALISSVKMKFTTCVKWTFISCMLLELTLCESLFQQSYKFSTENFCLRINFSKVNWTLNLLLNALGLSFSAAPDEYNMNGRDLFLPGLSPCPRISSRQIRDLHVMAPSSASDWSKHDELGLWLAEPGQNNQWSSWILPTWHADVKLGCS